MALQSRRAVFAGSWPTLCILSITPRSPAVRVRGQEPARSAIQDIKEAVAVRLSKQVLVAGIYHHRNLRGIPVVLVVPRKLEIPVQLAIVGIQSQKAVAVKIIASSSLPSIRWGGITGRRERLRGRRDVSPPRRRVEVAG